jgi:hypothetical protein
MKIKFFYFLSSLCLIISCKEVDKDSLIKPYKSAVNIKSLDKDIEKAFLEKRCLPVTITKSGFCEVITDTLGDYNYLKPNANLFWFENDSIASSYSFLNFCYSYIEKDTVLIKFHEGNGGHVHVLDVALFKDSFQINHAYWSNEKPLYYTATTFQDLTLCKKNYQVGDTIMGYLSFKGSLKPNHQRKLNFKGYFKCIIGNGTNPKDFVNSYEVCNDGKRFYTKNEGN